MNAHYHKMGEISKREKPVTAEKFDALADLVKSLATSMQTLVESKDPKKKAEMKEVDEAVPDDTPIAPSWTKAVHEILGKDFECEATYPTSGGVLFKVIVPLDKSNASESYLEDNKRDVRTKDIGNTGLEGVKKWCSLIKKNLARTQKEEIN